MKIIAEMKAKSKLLADCGNPKTQREPTLPRTNIFLIRVPQPNVHVEGSAGDRPGNQGLTIFSVSSTKRYFQRVQSQRRYACAGLGHNLS
jgi:hypothetical protein